MSERQSKLRYLRAWIDLKLIVRSPLHVGSGDVAELLARVPRERKSLRERLQSNGRKPTYRTMNLRRMHFGVGPGKREKLRASIPGSTIKGALKYAMADLQKSAGDEIFGVAGESERRSGRVRFSDSDSLVPPNFKHRTPPLWDAERGTGVRARVAIDPVTGAARKHHLTFYEFVPEGSEISFRLECFNITREALHSFCRILSELEDLRLGAGAALSAGELQWADSDAIRVEALTQEKFAEWCVNTQGAKEPPREVIWPPPSGSDDQYVDQRNQDKTAKAALEPINLELETLDPVLVASGLDRDEKKPEMDQKSGEYPDDLSVVQTPAGHIQIPASSLRGAMRARARKILIVWLRHFGVDAAEHDSPKHTLELGKKADRLLETLFGSTRIASTIQISDLVSTKTFDKSGLHHQFFNAIDRFTGGVAAGALYEAWAAPVGTVFKGKIAFRKNREVPAWARLLLGLVMRDLARGDVPLGWGTAKGYGSLRLNIDPFGLLKPGPSSPLKIDEDLSDQSLQMALEEALDIWKLAVQRLKKDHEVSTHEQ